MIIDVPFWVGKRTDWEQKNKPEHEKISVFCQGSEIFAKNIPEYIIL